MKNEEVLELVKKELPEPEFIHGDGSNFAIQESPDVCHILTISNRTVGDLLVAWPRDVDGIKAMSAKIRALPIARK